jgi:hypothetical protein
MVSDLDDLHRFNLKHVMNTNQTGASGFIPRQEIGSYYVPDDDTDARTGGGMRYGAIGTGPVKEIYPRIPSDPTRSMSMPHSVNLGTGIGISGTLPHGPGQVFEFGSDQRMPQHQSGLQAVYDFYESDNEEGDEVIVYQR